MKRNLPELDAPDQQSLSSRRSQPTRIITFAVLAVVLLVPVWTVHYAPLIDYPNHLARSFVLSHLGDSAYQFDTWYQPTWGPYPYLVMDLLLILLQKIFGIYTASKLVLSLAVLGVPVGIWMFAREANPGQEALALWSLPIAYGTFFLMGSVNMRLSMGMMFAVLALWLRYLNRAQVRGLNPLRSFLLLVLLTLVYFTHVFGFALALIAMTLYGLISHIGRRNLLFTWLAYIPGVLCYLYVKLEIPAPHMFILRSLREKVIGLSAILRGYSNSIDLLTYLALFLCVFVGVWKNPEFRVNRAWLAVTLCLFLGYWFAPLVLGEAWDIDIRLLEFSLAFAIVSVHFGRRARVVGVIGLLVFAIRIANTTYNFRVEDKVMHQLARGDQAIDRDARVMPIINSENDRQFRKGYLHFWSYGIIDRGWRASNLFQDPGVHTIKNKLPLYNPVSFASRHFQRERQWDLVKRDYDFLWTYNVPYLYPELDRIADPVFSDGKLRIYKLRGD